MNLILVVMLSTSVMSAEPPLPSVREVTAHLDDLYRADSSVAKLSMKITTKHFSRTLEIESWSLGSEWSLAVIRRPAREAGTATLKTPDGMWNFAPRADRLMRIPPGLLQESWMGSHFTNDDLMAENKYQQSFVTSASWRVDKGERLLVLTMIPKPAAPVVWTKIEFLLSQEGWMPRRATYWDGTEIVRTMFFRAVKDYGGRKMPSVMEVIPADKPGESTVVTYLEMRFNAPIKKSLFTPRGLRKAAQQR